MSKGDVFLVFQQHVFDHPLLFKLCEIVLDELTKSAELEHQHIAEVGRDETEFKL